MELRHSKDEGEPCNGGDFTVEYITLIRTASTIEATEEQAEDHPSEVNDVEASSPHGINDENLDVDHDEDAPLQFYNINDIIGSAMPCIFPPCVLVTEELYAITSDEPFSFVEAEPLPSWRNATMEDLGPLKRMTLGTSPTLHSYTRSQSDRGEMGVQDEERQAWDSNLTQGEAHGKGLCATTRHQLRRDVHVGGQAELGVPAHRSRSS